MGAKSDTKSWKITRIVISLLVAGVLYVVLKSNDKGLYSGKSEGGLVGSLRAMAIQKDLAGKYTARVRLPNGTENSKVIELKSDGRFTYWERATDEIGLAGKYDVEGNNITFTFEGGSVRGLVSKATLEHANNQGLMGVMAENYAGEKQDHLNCIVTNDDLLGRSADGRGIHYLHPPQ